MLNLSSTTKKSMKKSLSLEIKRVINIVFGPLQRVIMSKKNISENVC